jgi:glycosyltransferase involved in cell wall biosynthesis
VAHSTNGHHQLRIGVDATCWQNKRGYGRHGRALLSALVNFDVANHYTFFMDSAENVESLPARAELHLVKAAAPTAVAASADGHRSPHDMWCMSRAMSRAHLDLLLFPTIYSFVPVHTSAKKIVMIHDVIAERYPKLTIPEPKARLLWKTKVALGRWQADAIATVSDYSRRGIVEHFGLNPERVHVVGEASDRVFQVLKDSKLTPYLGSLGLKTEERIITYVGGFGPHKNLETLVAVFAKVATQPGFSDVKLVLVGEYRNEVFHSQAGTIKKQVKDLNLEERVLFTGYLPDSELVVLLNHSAVSVLPSLIEGFGLPAVEAAACGCPVIATKESPLPSLLGEGGIYFNPREPEELYLALNRVLESAPLREAMGQAARNAAARLTWEAAAEQMATLIRQVAA